MYFEKSDGRPTRPILQPSSPRTRKPLSSLRNSLLSFPPYLLMSSSLVSTFLFSFLASSPLACSFKEILDFKLNGALLVMLLIYNFSVFSACLNPKPFSLSFSPKDSCFSFSTVFRAVNYRLPLLLLLSLTDSKLLLLTLDSRSPSYLIPKSKKVLSKSQRRLSKLDAIVLGVVYLTSSLTSEGCLLLRSSPTLLLFKFKVKLLFATYPPSSTLLRLRLKPNPLLRTPPCPPSSRVNSDFLNSLPRPNSFFSSFFYYAFFSSFCSSFFNTSFFSSFFTTSFFSSYFSTFFSSFFSSLLCSSFCYFSSFFSSFLSKYVFSLYLGCYLYGLGCSLELYPFYPLASSRQVYLHYFLTQLSFLAYFRSYRLASSQR